MTRGRFVEEAVAIGDRIVSEAFWSRGRCNWLAPRQENGPSGGPTVIALDPSVSSGTAGVGLYLAHLSVFSGEDSHRETAEGAIRQSLKFVDYNDTAGMKYSVHLNGNWRFGFYLGTVGVAFAAHEVGSLVGNEQFVREGRRLIEGLRATLHEPAEFDLMYGGAGAIPPLFELARQGVPHARDLAIQLAHRVTDAAFIQDGRYSWGERSRNPQAKNWTGFSHGASGIGFALAVAYKATENERFREAAAGAFQYERDLYDPEIQNWPDFADSPTTEGRYPGRSTWCHGAPGIGLGRALAYPLLQERRLLDDARLAHANARQRLDFLMDSPGENLMVCCGLAGVADCVWHMEEALGMTGGLDRARAFGDWGIERFGREAQRRDPGWVEWPTGPAFGIHVPLLKGAAGIGNLLLRLEHPGRVPSVSVPGGSMVQVTA